MLSLVPYLAGCWQLELAPVTENAVAYSLTITCSGQLRLLKPCPYQANLIRRMQGRYVADAYDCFNPRSWTSLGHLAGGLGGEDI